MLYSWNIFRTLLFRKKNTQIQPYRLEWNILWYILVICLSPSSVVSCNLRPVIVVYVICRPLVNWCLWVYRLASVVCEMSKYGFREQLVAKTSPTDQRWMDWTDVVRVGQLPLVTILINLPCAHWQTDMLHSRKCPFHLPQGSRSSSKTF